MSIYVGARKVEPGETYYTDYCRTTIMIIIGKVMPESYDEKDTLWDLVCRCKILTGPDKGKWILRRISHLKNEEKDVVSL